jgi:hypothetical protein
MAAFNVGVAEAVTHKKKTRDMDFHVGWIKNFVWWNINPIDEWSLFVYLIN